MLSATVLHLRAKQSAQIIGATGRAVRGFWYQHWAQVEPAIGDALHSESPVKPFTLSPIMGLPHPQRGKTRIKSGQTAWLRITTLHPDLTQSSHQKWLPQLPDTINLANIPWKIENISYQDHAWAGYSQYKGQKEGYSLLPNLPRQWTLQFETPTAFKVGPDVHMPFPLPEALINSWLRRWNAFSSDPICFSPDRPLRDHLLVTNYQLKTVPIRYDRQLNIGCVGKITFRGKQLTQPERAYITLLANYAFFSGTGHHTTQGMGLTQMAAPHPLRYANRQSLIPNR